MKKITLEEQWNDGILIIKEIEDNKLTEFFNSNEKPDKLFHIIRYGEIRELQIISFYVRFYDNNNIKHEPCAYKNKYTKALVKELYSYIEYIKTAEYFVYIEYRNGLATGAYKYTDINTNKGLSFVYDDLLDIAKEQKELYAPREGYSPCAYCRKQTPNEKLITKKIIGRGRKQVWDNWKNTYKSKACITEEYLKFCSNKCAGNEQMAREG